MLLEGRYEEIIYQARALAYNPRVVPKSVRGRIYMTAAAVAEEWGKLEAGVNPVRRDDGDSAALEPVEQISVQVGQAGQWRASWRPPKCAAEKVARHGCGAGRTYRTS